MRYIYHVYKCESDECVYLRVYAYGRESKARGKACRGDGGFWTVARSRHSRSTIEQSSTMSVAVAVKEMRDPLSPRIIRIMDYGLRVEG